MGLALASTRLAKLAAASDRRRASSAPEDIDREPAEGVDRGATHETVAGAWRPNRTRQAERPTVRRRKNARAPREITPEIKAEARRVIENALPDPELRTKIMAIYSQSPLLKGLLE